MGAQKHCRRAGNGPALREEALPLQPQAVCRERSKQAASCHIKVASRRNLAKEMLTEGQHENKRKS